MKKQTINTLLSGLIIVVTLLLTACASCTKNAYSNYDAVVSQELGENYFKTIAAALAAAPAESPGPYKIFIAAGNYYEKLNLDKANVQLIGAGQDKTRIYYDAYSGQLDPQGTPWGTFRSATLTITAPGVHLSEMTIENTFDFLANDALDKENVNRINGTQAVALTLDGTSDKFVARHLTLLGYQDTLYVNAGRAWFDQSVIAGNVDFIFGRGNALFTKSEIKTVGRAQNANPHGYLVAPSTQISSFYGLTFIDCKLTRVASVADNSVPLGRPWHPTTNFPDGRYADPNAIGKAVFINCWMDAHITQDGWYSMGGTMRDGTKAPFYPEDARFFEYQSTGPGAAINSKRRQLSELEAKDYTMEKIFGDWQPAY